MTMRETLAFSGRVQGVGAGHAKLLLEFSRREKESNIKPDPDLDLFMKATALTVKKLVKSNCALKWALERFSDEGKVMFKLLHVHARITTVPTPTKCNAIQCCCSSSGKLYSISQVRDDVATAYKKEMEWKTSKRLLPHKQLCSEKKVEAEIVQIEADDVPVTISNEVSRSKKGKLHQSKNIDTALEGTRVLAKPSLPEVMNKCFLLIASYLVQTWFDAWGCFAFGEDTKDIITMNLEKLLLCFQSGDSGATHIALLILSTGHAIRSSVSALLWQVPRGTDIGLVCLLTKTDDLSKPLRPWPSLQEFKELALVMLLLELSRIEKEANIKPDPDLDLFMKATALDGQEASVITDYIIKVQVIKMLGKSMKILEVDKRSLMLSSSLIVAVAVNGSRKSNCALKWGLERFSDEGNVRFKLLHVRVRITTVPTPMGNYIPISQVRDDVATAYKKEMEWKTSKRLLPHKQLCSEKKRRLYKLKRMMYQLQYLMKCLSPYTSEADGSNKYEISDTISCIDSDFTYDTSTQTGDSGATHLALLILPTGHAIGSSVFSSSMVS
ncbi:hypothetical protein Sjap_011272 [Stephania japonica]|uniref:Uncharacterized protein n=1 Tax=Stephania japonica TaxID=461633 RepID=A0AAP0JD29_9MAGN